MNRELKRKIPVKIYVVLFVFSLAIRLVLLAWAGPYTDRDTVEYVLVAENFVEQGDFVIQDEFTFQWRPYTFRMPGYPLYLASFYRIFGADSSINTYVAISQIIFASLLSLSAAYVANYYFSVRAGVLAGMLMAVDPFLSLASIAILTDALFSFLYGASFIACLNAIEKRKFKWAFLWGLLLGLAGMVRPIVQYQYFLMIFAFVITAVPWRKRGRLIIAALTGFFLVLGAWGFRNKITTGYYELETNQGMSMLWRSAYLLEPSTNKDYRQDPVLAAARDIAVIDPSHGGIIFQNIREQLGVSEREANEIMVKLAYENIFDNPIKYAGFAIGQIVAFQTGIGELVSLAVHMGVNPNLKNGLAANLQDNQFDLVAANLALRVVTILVFTILPIYGLFYTWANYREARLFTTVFMLAYLYHIAVVSMVVGNARYHLPLHMLVWVYVSIIFVDKLIPFTAERLGVAEKYPFTSQP